MIASFHTHFNIHQHTLFLSELILWYKCTILTNNVDFSFASFELSLQLPKTEFLRDVGKFILLFKYIAISYDQGVGSGFGRTSVSPPIKSICWSRRGWTGFCAMGCFWTADRLLPHMLHDYLGNQRFTVLFFCR